MKLSHKHPHAWITFNETCSEMKIEKTAGEGSTLNYTECAGFWGKLNAFFFKMTWTFFVK